MNINIDPDIIKYSYESTISCQQIMHGILESSTYSLLEAESKKDSKLTKFKDWIVEKLKKIAETVRKWVTAIVTFLTKTLPSAVGKFINKILVFLKIKKASKKVNTSKLSVTDKEKVKDAVKVVNATTAKKIADNPEAVKELSMLEKVALDKINAISDIDTQKKLYDALKNKDFVTTADSVTVECPNVIDKITITLNSISDLCEEAVNFLETQLERIVKNADIIAKGTNPGKATDDKDTKNRINTKYMQIKTYLINHNKMYAIKMHLNTVKPTKMDIKDIEKAVERFSNDKNATTIAKVAKDISKAILKSLDDIKSKADNNQEAVSQSCQELSKVQAAIIQFITDATNDYTSYIKYAIDLYGSALSQPSE